MLLFKIKKHSICRTYLRNEKYKRRAVQRTRACGQDATFPDDSLSLASRQPLCFSASTSLHCLVYASTFLLCFLYRLCLLQADLCSPAPSYRICIFPSMATLTILGKKQMPLKLVHKYKHPPTLHFLGSNKLLEVLFSRTHNSLPKITRHCFSEGWVIG